MSHFNNVQNIFHAIDEPSMDPIIWLLESFDDEGYEEFARSLLFVLVSMKARMEPEAWARFKLRMDNRTVNMEINEMFLEGDD